MGVFLRRIRMFLQVICFYQGQFPLPRRSMRGGWLDKGFRAWMRVFGSHFTRSILYDSFLAILTNQHMATGTWKSWDGGMKPFSLVRHCII